jgi:hypothetical protein
MPDDDRSSSGRAPRMAVRFTDDDLAWLAEQAEDEGVEPATLVRMIVSRLRKGRAPLIRMMEQSTPVRALQPRAVFAAPQPAMQYEVPADDVADDILQQRLAEVESGEVVQLHQPVEEAIATPLLRVPRQQWNPGRN